MSKVESNKIASNLFQEDIRNNDLKKDFEKIFEIKIEDFLSDYEYDEIDELTKDSVMTRIRVCIAEIESNINMSTYYLFDN